MKAAPFEYHTPTSVEEAVALLAEHGDEAKVLAGGQSLVPILALRLARFEHLVDLNRIVELQQITEDDGLVSIGAMTRQSAAEHSSVVASAVPLLSRALPHIGHFQIRNRGTIGGSLSHADPASELPTVAVTLDAEFDLASTRGVRRVPAREFFVSVWETALENDELTVAVHFPKKAQKSGFAIEELAWRLGDFAIAGVAAAVQLDGSERIDRAAITFMGMGPTPMPANDAANALVGVAKSDADLKQIASQAVEMTSPTDDVHTSGAYRRRVATAMCERALAAALEEASHE